VSFFDLKKLNQGSYDQPRSGVGIEYAPLGPPVTAEQVLIHEIGFLARNDWWIFPNTVSPFWRLYYNAKSGHRVVFNDQTIELAPDHLVLIPDHLVFDSEGLGSVPHFWMAFSVGLYLKHGGPRVLKVRAEEAQLINRICRSFTGPGRGDRFSIFHQSAALLHLVIARPEIGWDEQPRSSSALKVAAHISRNFAGKLDVPGLAKLAGVSPRALSDLFQREYHVSPTRFISRVRVSEAAKMLVETELPLDVVAQRTGFPNRFYLTRVFTKLTGKAPACYRRDHRNSGPTPDGGS